MKTMTVKLPQAMDRALAVRAKRQNRTKSALVRQAVETLLSDRGQADGGTFQERAGDLAGRVAGPKDLSHSQRHMKDFGR